MKLIFGGIKLRRDAVPEPGGNNIGDLLKVRVGVYFTYLNNTFIFIIQTHPDRLTFMCINDQLV